MVSKIIQLTIQTPTGTPNPGENTSIDFSSTFDILVYVVIPICLIAFYFYWRYKQRKNKE